MSYSLKALVKKLNTYLEKYPEKRWEEHDNLEIKNIVIANGEVANVHFKNDPGNYNAISVQQFMEVNGITEADLD